jgi:hypothetical protein
VTDFKSLLEILADADVKFVVAGGFAASAHGSNRFTSDLDVVYQRTSENMTKIVKALAPFNPQARGAQPGIPFTRDERTLKMGLNFTLTTKIGWIDLLGEIAGAGDFKAILPKSEVFKLFDSDIRCLSLEPLIKAKRATGRKKDEEAIAELEMILAEKQKPD